MSERVEGELSRGILSGRDMYVYSNIYKVYICSGKWGILS